MKKDQNLKEIAKQIEELCNNSGLDYFFAVSDSKEIISSIGAGNHRSEKLEDLRSYWVNTYLKYSSITFLDLYNLIQEAERNEFGFHIPFKDDDSVSFHIYNGKRQMNLNIVDKSTIGFDGISHFESVLNFIFDPTNETVRIVKVKDGVADYFNYLELNWHSSINNEKFLTYISDVETYGCSVKDIIYKSIIQSLGKEMI